MYPTKRNLDGIYFRVCRDGKWQNVCMTDLSREEFEQLTAGRHTDWVSTSYGIMVDVSKVLFDFANGPDEAREMLWDLICMTRKEAERMNIICPDDDD